MNDTLTKERQQELFEEFSPSSPKRPERIPTLAKSHKPILITTTTEQMLLIGILSILVLCGIFFLGVLRGKSLQTNIMGETPVGRASVAAPQAVRVQAAPIQSQPRAQVVHPAVSVSRPLLAPADTTVASKPYTIQLVTHRGQGMAEAEVTRLRKAGYDSFIITSDEYFLVCVGRFATKDEAKKQLRAFSSRFKDSFVKHR